MSKYEFATEPYDHQREALTRSWDKEYFAYFMEMGTGKTKLVLDNAGILLEQGKINGLVVLALKGAYLNWVGEIEDHLPERIKKITEVGVWKPSLTIKVKESLKRAYEAEYFGILLMNLEAVNSAKAKAILEGFLKNRDCMLVIDESRMIKNIKAKKTKTLVDLGQYARYRRIMTGSPVTNQSIDIYGQSQFLKPGLITKTESGFKARYSVLRPLDITTKAGYGAQVKVVVGSKNAEELADKIEEWSYRVLKDDCLDLPPKLYQFRLVPLTPQQERMYRELRDLAYHQFEDGEEMSYKNTLHMVLRLHQVVCGIVKTDSGEERSIESNRMGILMDTLEELDGKAIIWANYINNIEQIIETVQKAYGPGAVVAYYGAIGLEQRELAVESIQNGEARFLVANPQTAGRGRTLTAATTQIYYSNNFDLELRLQSEDRSHRIGQTHNVNYIDLVSKGTVDEKIIKSLRNKINLASVLLKENPKDWII